MGRTSTWPRTLRRVCARLAGSVMVSHELTTIAPSSSCRSRQIVDIVLGSMRNLDSRQGEVSHRLEATSQSGLGSEDEFEVSMSNMVGNCHCL